MEKKELHSMVKHRGLLSALGLMALFGLSAPEVNAATMSLTVLLDGSPAYSVTGATATSVSAVVSDLNTALNGSGYSFSSLSGASNNPGTQGPVGGFISDSGNLSYDPAGGTGGVLTIIVTEDGFTSPASGTGNVLTSAATSNYSGTGAGTTSPLAPTYQTYLGNFSDSSSPAVTAATPIISQASNGTAQDSHSDSTTVGLGLYTVPYTLSSTTVISMNSSTALPSNNVFTGKTSVLASGTVPEPASLVMLVTGMPLPLVVMGLLRRRRAAA